MSDAQQKTLSEITTIAHTVELLDDGRGNVNRGKGIIWFHAQGYAVTAFDFSPERAVTAVHLWEGGSVTEEQAKAAIEPANIGNLVFHSGNAQAALGMSHLFDTYRDQPPYLLVGMRDYRVVEIKP